ncbi:sushi, nidogen and EGF-like domain-containing protein 1 isoform X1 [Mauremys mutica]|uniref:sushi, nidogen and EGF-like domain-containing protein 1 isoform X1 n=2 Tax=Mauremys mutica TaxID=74926 RepID=UPI001D15E94F|nr:sushi, nidogen and EGF-like domain-containing protein 1 isoform X1 [Mauremys mutica]
MILRNPGQSSCCFTRTSQPGGSQSKGLAEMKTPIAFLLLLLGLVLPAPVEMAEDSLLYPYGPAQSDQRNPKADDGASLEIPISMTFTFYGKEHRSLYVNNNGVVSFGVSVSQYTPDPFPLADGRPFVAPYWGDVNNNLGGDVYYRETRDPELLRRLTRDINQYFPEIPFTATWAFVATWDRVAYYGSTSQKTNTFQAVLANDGKVTFIMLNYGTIQWTTGTASGGDANTGLGGTPAQAGFNSGDDKNFYNIPGSRTDAILHIGQTSNVGVQGRWVFQVNDFKVTGVPTESNDCWL